MRRLPSLVVALALAGCGTHWAVIPSDNPEATACADACRKAPMTCTNDCDVQLTQCYAGCPGARTVDDAASCSDAGHKARVHGKAICHSYHD